jgi:hypothetical protein
MGVLSEHKWLLMLVVAAGRALRVDWSSNYWLMYSLFLLDFLFSLVRLRVLYFIVLLCLIRIARILHRSFIFLSGSASPSLGLVLDDLNLLRADHGHLHVFRLLFLIRLHLNILLKRERVYFRDRFLLLEDRSATIASSLIVDKVCGGSSAQHRRLVEGADVVPS